MSDTPYRGIIIVGRFLMFVDFVGYPFQRIYVPICNELCVIDMQQTSYPQNYVSRTSKILTIHEHWTRQIWMIRQYL